MLCGVEWILRCLFSVENIVDGSSNVEIGTSEEAGAGEVWQKLIAALRQKGCHGVVEFLTNVSSLGYPSISMPYYNTVYTCLAAS